MELTSAGIEIQGNNCTIHYPNGYNGAILVAARPNERNLVATTEDDESGSLTGEGLSLAKHGQDVQAKALAFSGSVGLADERVDDISLAGLLHDEGKADGRFQIWLRGGDRLMAEVEAGEPLAKSLKMMSPGESLAARRSSQNGRPMPNQENNDDEDDG